MDADGYAVSYEYLEGVQSTMDCPEGVQFAEYDDADDMAAMYLVSLGGKQTRQVSRIPQHSQTTSSQHNGVTPLEQLLSRSLEGLAILKFRKRGIPLRDMHRKELALIVINDLISTDPKREIHPDALSLKAREIAAFLPTEAHSRYFMYAPNDTVTGLLQSAYDVKKMKYTALCKDLESDDDTGDTSSGSNGQEEVRAKRKYKKKATSEGEVKKRKYVAPTPSKSTRNDEHSDDCDTRFASFVAADEGDESNISEDLHWLTTVESGKDLKTKWARTCRARLRRLRVRTIPLMKYIAEYPALKGPEALSLLLQDFATLHPSSMSSLFDSLTPALCRQIVLLAYQKALKDRLRMLEIFSAFSSRASLYEEPRLASADAALLSLPFVFFLPRGFGKTHPKKDAKGHSIDWKVTKNDVQDHFIMQVAKSADLAKMVYERALMLQEIGCTFRPMVVLVGESILKTEQYLVVCDCHMTVKFCFNSVLEAVDACFKIYHATNTPYPEISCDVWKFLRSAFYKISKPSDPFNKFNQKVFEELKLTCTV